VTATGVLADDYRPRTFADVSGQKHITPVLAQIARAAQDPSSGLPGVPAALLLSGTHGSGKTSCARIFAAALNCTGVIGDACGKCDSCLSVLSGSSISTIEIDAASYSGVDDIRRLHSVVGTAHGGRYRVILIDECQSLSTAANHALLKLLEEPAPGTCFVLVTTEPKALLPTVRSRTMTFGFRNLSEHDILSRLQQITEAEKIEADHDLLVRITLAAQGSMRDALMLLDQVRRVGITDADRFLTMFGLKDVSVPIVLAAMRGDHAVLHSLVSDTYVRTGQVDSLVADLSCTIADLLSLKSGGILTRRTESEVAERVQIADALSTPMLVEAASVLWALAPRIRGQDPASAVGTAQIAAVMLSSVLSAS
jgi:DNA polymerase-3 subunit gamma/tau